MRTMHLFAGAGGGLLADLILGHQPVCAVELDAHCCNVLRARSADGWFSGLHVHHGDVREFDPSPWVGGVDCISAGFPCQDISAAGRGNGIAGERSGLVWEVFRAIDTVRPGLVWLENSPRIRTKGRREIIAALVARGYSWRDGTLAASDVGAGHERKRWWLIAANADGMRQLEQERRQCQQRGWTGDCAEIPAVADAYVRQRDTQTAQVCAGRHASDHGDSTAADCLRDQLQIAIQRGGLSPADAETIEAAARYVGAYHWSPPDAGVCRVVDGLASRMDRIKCAGNGQVPLQAAAAWCALTER